MATAYGHSVHPMARGSGRSSIGAAAVTDELDNALSCADVAKHRREVGQARAFRTILSGDARASERVATSIQSACDGPLLALRSGAGVEPTQPGAARPHRSWRSTEPCSDRRPTAIVRFVAACIDDRGGSEHRSCQAPRLQTDRMGLAPVGTINLTARASARGQRCGLPRSPRVRPRWSERRRPQPSAVSIRRALSGCP